MTDAAVALAARAVDPTAFASAMLNILEDASNEASRLASTQSAVLNILDDMAEEKAVLSKMQHAVLNVLEDAAEDKARLEATQRAVLNILDDSAEETARLAETQRAVLNILDDFDVEKTKVEKVNVDLQSEITERLRTEEALRHANVLAEAATRELEAFSYSVAHDLRAPLRSIDGFSQAFLEDYGEHLDAEGSRYLKNVREAAQNMGELIDGLLNLSRVTRAELRRTRVDLSEVARAVVGRLMESEPDRSVEVVIEDGLVASADERLLEVVLTNLLGNAWKFTRKRSSARIELAVKAGVQPAVYCVRDNGAGFDPRYSNKLFQVFQRLHSDRDFEGTGIGLATVSRIVSRHGGKVWAESEVDHGATFYFTLEEGLSS